MFSSSAPGASRAYFGVEIGEVQKPSHVTLYPMKNHRLPMAYRHLKAVRR